MWNLNPNFMNTHFFSTGPWIPVEIEITFPYFEIHLLIGYFSIRAGKGEGRGEEGNLSHTTTFEIYGMNKEL